MSDDTSSADVLKRELLELRARIRELEQQQTEAMAASQDKLRRAERLAAIGTLAAGIAHEINNPLGAILLSAQFALEVRENPESMAESLEQIIDYAQRSKNIIQNVLTFARTENETKSPEQITRVFEHVRKLNARETKDASCHMILQEANHLPDVVINRTGIEQVFINLVQNAMQAGAREVQLAAKKDGDRLICAVTDDGRGMSRAEMRRIFDPFYTSRQTEGGTGLGLSIVHGIMQSHGGTIEVDSTVGQGTTFTLTLPLSAQASVE
jgi:two-component system NtrC family sensor kinase